MMINDKAMRGPRLNTDTWEKEHHINAGTRDKDVDKISHASMVDAKLSQKK
jgi:hypothetical protein